MMHILNIALQRSIRKCVYHLCEEWERILTYVIFLMLQEKDFSSQFLELSGI